MPFANSNRAKIHYSVKGEPSRPTLLLLMGLGGHATEWGNPFVDALAAHYRVVTMDNRGIGESTSEVAEWSLEDMAQDALSVIDALHCREVLLGGTSMGGMIAQLVASIAPERITKLALMATTFGGRESVPPTAEANSLFTPLPGTTPGQMQRRTLELLTGPGFAAAHAALIDEFAALRERKSTRAKVFQAQFMAIMKSDRSERVRALGMPTLVVHGLDDQLVPVENGRMLAQRIPNAQLVLFEACGHFPHLEVPDACAAALHDFFG
jgi:3-oxoadipate enol-lactonase